MIQKAIEQLEKLVSFDTTSAFSNLECINYIAGYLDKFGIQSSINYNAERNKAGLVCRIGPDVEGGVVLSGHTDVVPVTGQKWDSNPFTLTRINNVSCDQRERSGGEAPLDILVGRGTSDMKGFIACCLALLEIIDIKKLKQPIYFAFSYDEEVGCLAAKQMTDAVKAIGGKPDFAIIGEPTLMKLATHHKGIKSSITNITGLEGHSSNPAKGINANFIAARLVSFIEKLQQEEMNKRDDRFDPPYTTFNVGILKGGEASNIIAGKSEVWWEIRPTPTTNTEEIVKKYEEYAAILARDFSVNGLEPKIVNVTRSDVCGLLAKGEYINKVLRMLGSNETIGVAFTTEAGVFDRNGIPAVVVGPGSITEAHKPNEFIAISQLEECMKFLGNLITELSLK